MVAPGSVGSRLGAVFPFLLVLVDLQYEGEFRPVGWPGSGSWAGEGAALPGARLGTGRASPAEVGPEPGSGSEC